ncbi:MAG TPA: hypothetical protein VMW50_00700 [Dehalococcoidia bacterium]|nr:hypothetical protein [Dehalococcoidia bacterium]
MYETKLDLIQALEAEQRRRQLDGNGFSTMLGIHYSNWSRYKNRQRPLSKNALMSIIQNLPELGKHVEDYMRQGKNTGDMEITTEPVESSKTLKKMGAENRG